ncbi:hypothetical protein O0I10_004264 [Lichtheimia ornata]|uniref:B30.2/SPRY domain-containing protein n=1 Tax=Lichtheimia ornata TaxID=688661 RepID=A0AAD7Y291_9FUNG|nr:uncharacterized protein O0I10_004264 [Lichtheimia ornata]KAJ8660037.1 hypothetical protein O0I10_004264 [Lichtheimia ornata]
MAMQTLRRSGRHIPVVPRYIAEYTVYGEAHSLCSTLDELPTQLNALDMSYNLDLHDSNLHVFSIGGGSTDDYAGIVRSNRPIPELCDVFYFEAKVMDAGRHGFIVVGVCSDQADLEQLPGWGTDTWGYHADDGRAFDGNSGNDQGLPFGPGYTVLDVIGCGIDMQRRDIFYTKNGRFIGRAFHAVRFGIDLHPCIGLNSPGESVVVNFGNQPFVFDIEKYIKDQQMKKVQELQQKYSKD